MTRSKRGAVGVLRRAEEAGKGAGRSGLAWRDLRTRRLNLSPGEPGGTAAPLPQGRPGQDAPPPLPAAPAPLRSRALLPSPIGADTRGSGRVAACARWGRAAARREGAGRGAAGPGRAVLPSLPLRPPGLPGAAPRELPALRRARGGRSPLGGRARGGRSSSSGGRGLGRARRGPAARPLLVSAEPITIN